MFYYEKHGPIYFGNVGMNKENTVSVSVLHKRENLLQSLLRKLGLALYRYKENHVYVRETYVVRAMKMLDVKEIPEFVELAKPVIKQKKTYLDYDRLYTLYQAVLNVRQLSVLGSLAEVGVHRGGSTYFIASSVDKLYSVRPKIHAFDTFEGHSSEDITPDLDGPHVPGKFSDISFSEVSQDLSVFPNVVLHKGRFQDRSVDISGESFCFVHIDVDIYAVTRACLDFFADALMVGGMMIVDDYGVKTCEGAKRAVDNFAGERNNFIKFHVGTAQCLLVRMG